MDERKKKILTLLGSLFVLVIFITGYAASGDGISGGNSRSNESNRSSNVTYYPAFGVANAVVIGYGNLTELNLLNVSSANSILDALNGMQANNTISAYSQLGSTVNVYLNGSAYAFEQLLSGYAAGNYISFSATEYVALPITANMTPAGSRQQVPVYFTAKSYPLQKGALDPLNSTVRVSISTEISVNGVSYVAGRNTTLRQV